MRSGAAAAFGHVNFPAESMGGAKYHLSHGATELTLDASRQTLRKATDGKTAALGYTIQSLMCARHLVGLILLLLPATSLAHLL
jgi:hypothetical protein